MKVAFDGWGLSDMENPYHKRLATFERVTMADGERERLGLEWEKRINAYDYLKHMLIMRGFTDERLESLVRVFLKEEL